MATTQLPPFDLRVIYDWMRPEAVMAARLTGATPQCWLDAAMGPIAAEDLLSTTRASGINLPDAAGVYQSIGVNELPRTDRGLYVNGQLHIVNRSSGDFRVSPPANTGWARSGTASYQDKPSIFAGAVACEQQCSGAGSEGFSISVTGLAGAYVFDVIIERGTNTLSTLGVAGGSGWVAVAHYYWSTNSLTATGGTTIASSRIQDLGVGPNGGALRRLSIQLDVSDGTDWDLRVYPAGGAQNTHSAIVHYGALYSGVIHSDAAFLSPVGSSGTLFASDIRAVQGVRPSNGQPEPFPGWEAAGLDNGFTVLVDFENRSLSPVRRRALTLVSGATNWRLGTDLSGQGFYLTQQSPFAQIDVPGGQTGGRTRVAARIAASAAVAQKGSSSVATASFSAPANMTQMLLGHFTSTSDPWSDWIYELQVCKPLSDVALLDWVNA